MVKVKFTDWGVGIVHPREYNWKKTFKQFKNSLEMYIDLDIGKVLGLCKYIEQLEYTNEELRQNIWNSDKLIEQFISDKILNEKIKIICDLKKQIKCKDGELEYLRNKEDKTFEDNHKLNMKQEEAMNMVR